MAQPQIPIDVDPDTGIWRTDGLPMIYLPRHFLVNMQKAIEAAIGPAAYRDILYASSDLSALQWCRAEAKTHGLTPVGTFRHYLKRLSQRGWAQFRVRSVDSATGRGIVEVRHSVFVAEAGPASGRKVCYMFRGWFCGALEWVATESGRSLALTAEEIQCAAEGGHDHCLFEIQPAS